MYICAKAKAIFRELAGVELKREAEILQKNAKIYEKVRKSGLQ